MVHRKSENLTTLAILVCIIRVVLHVGIVTGMTVPAMYVKYQDKIKRGEEKLKAQLKRYYDTVDEKVVKKIQNKVTVGEEKEKKVE